MSGIRLLDCSKLAINWNNDNNVTIFRDEVIVHLFLWCCFISLFNFLHWSKFHVNIMTGSGVMTISYYKGLSRNPETRNNTVWVLPISGGWGEREISNSAWIFLIKFYWMLHNARVTAFWVIKGKPICYRYVLIYFIADNLYLSRHICINLYCFRCICVRANKLKKSRWQSSAQSYTPILTLNNRLSILI